ncbi:MAG: DNA-protecting protein DprA [Gammaproteobacteria bacterium]|nr:DNA-protecting protein DprA [Gammaproteobacteria bacterium]
METVSSRSELDCMLALLHAPGLGPVQLQRLSNALPALQQLFEERGLPQRRALPEITQRYLQQPDWHAVERDLVWCDAASDRYIISLRDPAYPAQLREIHAPPPVLFITGHPAQLHRPQLAIVGSRNPTPTGRELAHEFAAQLARHGLAITSGLALGIDAASHHGALSAGGVTLAITGAGLDRIYPASHGELANSIAATGAVVSEFPVGTPPRAEHFPRRNRIISGLSLGILVVEAARRSGSLITARLALEQGREVFAIPGSIRNPLSSGCHALIRIGAKLVEECSDILEEIPFAAQHCALPETTRPADQVQRNLEGDPQKVLNSLGPEPIPVDVVITRSGLTAEKVSSILLMLELEQLVVLSPGGGYLRTK